MATFNELTDSLSLEGLSSLTPSSSADEELKSLLTVPEYKPTPVDPTAGTTAFGRGFSSGLDSLSSALGTAFKLGVPGLIEEATSIDTVDHESVKARHRIMKENQDKSLMTTSFDDVREAYKEDPVKALDKLLTFTGETVGASLPYSAPNIAGGVIGAQVGKRIAAGLAARAVGAAVGQTLIPIPFLGALIGGTIAGIPMFFGMNTERQIEERARENKGITPLPEELQLWKALGSAPVQGALGTAVFLALGLGSKAVPKSLTLAPPAQLTAARKTLGNMLATEIPKGMAKGVIVEAPTEVMQQAIERLQAGLEIDPADGEAFKEYLESAVGGGVAGFVFGAFGGGGRGVRRYSRQASMEEQQNEIDRAIAEGSFLIDSLEEGGVAPAPEQVAPTLEESATAATSPIGEVETDVEVDETSTFVEDPAQGTLGLPEPEPKPKPKRKAKGKTTPEVKPKETKGKLATTLELNEKGLPKKVEPKIKPPTGTTTGLRMIARSPAEVEELNRIGKEQAAKDKANQQAADLSDNTSNEVIDETTTDEQVFSDDVVDTDKGRMDNNQALNEIIVDSQKGEVEEKEAAEIANQKAQEAAKIKGEIRELRKAFLEGNLTEKQADRAVDLGLNIPIDDDGNIIYPTKTKRKTQKRKRKPTGIDPSLEADFIEAEKGEGQTDTTLEDAEVIADQTRGKTSTYRQTMAEMDKDDLVELSEAEQEKVREFISEKLGASVDTIFMEQASIAAEYEKAGGTNPSDVLAFTDPIKRIIYVATNPSSLTDVESMVGEEVYHMAEGLNLFTDAERKALQDTLTVEMARENGLGPLLDAYPEALHEMEARAKLAGLWLSGASVKGLPTRTRSLLQRFKDFLRQVANFITGKEPTAVEIQRRALRRLQDGQLAREVGGQPSVDLSGVMANRGIFKSLSNKRVVDAAKKSLADIKKSRLKNETGEVLSTWNNWMTHLSGLAEKFPKFKPFYNALMDQTHKRNSIKNQALIILRPYLNMVSAGIPFTKKAEAAKKAAKDIEQFAVVADYLEMRKSVILNGGKFKEDRKGAVEEVLPPFTLPLKSLRERGGSTWEALDVPDNQEYLTLDEAYRESYRASSDTFSYIYDQVREAMEKYLADIGHNFIKDFADIENTSERRDAIIKFLEPFLELNKKGEVIPFDKRTKKALTKEIAEAKGLFKEGDKAKSVEKLYEELGTIYDVMVSLRQAEVTSYIPRIRNGEYVVQVKRINRKSTKGKKLPDVVEELISVPNSAFSKFGFRAKSAVEEDKLASQIESEAKEMYPDSDKYEVSSFRLTRNEVLKEGNQSLRAALPMIERVMMALGTTETPYSGMEGDKDSTEAFRKTTGKDKAFAEKVMKDLKTAMGMRDFERFTTVRKRPVVQGYYNIRNNNGTYLSSALDRYINSGANQASSIFYQNDLHTALNNLDKPDSRDLYRYAKDSWEYFNTFKAGQEALRAFAFHAFLGFNISSSILNLLQIPQSSWPVMSSVYGVGSTSFELGRALKDAIKLTKFTGQLGKYGFDFTGEKPKGIAQADWDVLVDLNRRGIIQPIQNIDLQGEYNQDSGLVNRLGVPNQLMFASSYAFGYTENINRISTALAAARLARKAATNKKTAKKVRLFASQTRFSERMNNLVNADGTITNQNNFEKLVGEMFVEKTQFMMGKENRAGVMRNLFGMGSGMGGVATQFMSYPMQMMNLYAQSLRRSLGRNVDIETRKMAAVQLALMSLGFFAFAGAMGLPFADDSKEVIKLISRNFGDQVEFDIGKYAYDLVKDLTSDEAAELIMYGPISRSLNMDLSRRAGMGSLVPFLRLMSGTTAPQIMTGPAGTRIIDHVEDTLLTLNDPNVSLPMKIAAPLSLAIPVSIQRLYNGLVKVPFEGFTSKKGQRGVLGPEEVDGGDMLINIIGFTPRNLAQEWRERGVHNYLNYRNRKGKETMTTALAALMTKAIRSKNSVDSAKYQQKFNELMAQVQEHDMEAYNRGDISAMYRINIRTIRDRVRFNLNPRAGLIRRTRRDLRGVQAEELEGE